MKGNSGKGDNPERDLWKTPQALFSELNEQYKFVFDCCANADNAKCAEWSDNFEKIAESDMAGKVAWMNPPFSNAKKMFRHFFKVVSTGVAIYRCDNMETEIWQEVIVPGSHWVYIFNKRICYEGFEGNSARFPSALVGVGVMSPTIPPLSIGGVIFLGETKKNSLV